jgi:hypothetical protein
MSRRIPLTAFDLSHCRTTPIMEATVSGRDCVVTSATDGRERKTPTTADWQRTWVVPDATPSQRKGALWNLSEADRRAAEHGRFTAPEQVRRAKCKACRKPFTAKRSDAKHCSQACRKKASRRPHVTDNRAA